MAFDPSFADAALQAGYSKEEVEKYASQQDPFVRDALKAGYNFDDVLTHLKQGGEQANEEQIRNQSQANSESNARREANQQIDAVGGEANVQADGMLRTEDQSQRQRNDQASQRQRNGNSIQLSGSQVAQGGELNAKQENAKAEDGYGSQVGKESGQGLRIQSDEGNQTQVTSGGGGVRPSSTQSKVVAGLGSLAESAAQLAGFHFGGKAALSSATKLIAKQGTGALLGEAAVAPIAAAEEVLTGGLATPLAIGTEVLGGLAGGWIADKLEGLAERLTGTHGDIEKAKQENPLLSQVVNYSVMAPLAFKSTANLIKLAQKEGIGAAAGAAGIGAGLGAATYPLQVGMDKALNYLTGQTDEEKMSWKGLLENAAIGGILGGAGLPETAKVEENLNTIRLTNKKIKEDAKDPNFVVENAFSQVEKHIENGDSKSAQEALQRAKAVKEANPATDELEENRNHRQEFLEQQIKSEEKPAEAPSEAQPETPSEEQVKETSGIPTEQGISPNEQATIKAKERVAQGNRKSEEEIKGEGYPSSVKEENIPVEDLHGKTAREGLTRIATDPNMPNEWKDLAETFSKFPSKMLDEDKVIDQTKLPSQYKKYTGGKRAARYQPALGRTGYIGIAKNGFESARTFVHETGHTITADSIHKWIPTNATTGKEYAKSLESSLANPNTPDEIKRLINLYKSALEQRGETEKYLGKGDFVKSNKPHYFDKIDYPNGTVYQYGAKGKAELSAFEKLFKDAGIKYQLDKYQGGGRFRISPEEMEKLQSQKQKLDIEFNDFQNGKTYTITGLKLKQPASASARPDITVRKGSVYGFANLHEFVSETWSSPEFRELLKGLKGDGKESMWQTFIKIISKILRIEKGSLAEAVIDTSLDISRLRGKELEGKEYEPPKRLIKKEKKPKEIPPVEKPTEPKGTKLHEAAFQPRDGIRFVGANHDEALKKALDAGEITKDFYDQVAGNENAENRNHPEFGFTTNHIDESGNREFVDRKQGHEISSKAGQLLVDEPTFKHPEGGYYLHSNETKLDAYPEPEEKPVVEKPVVETKVEKPEIAKDPLEKLTEDIKEKADAKPGASVVDLAKEAEKISKQATATKDAVTKGVGSVKGAFEAMKNAYVNRPKWTDFKKALGEWSFADNSTSIKVRKAVAELKKAIPDELKREAITNYIQAGGDEALLRERANASKPKYKKGYEAALTLTDAEKAHAKDISKYLSDMLEEGINSGMLNHGIENYITQVWKKENPVTKNLQASLQGGKLNKNFQFAKKRVFDSYFEGEQAGYEPASKDVASLIAAYDISFRKTEAVRAFVKNMLEGKAEDGKPLVQLSGYAQPVGEKGVPPSAYLIKPQARPEGAVTEDGRPYVSINHPAFKGWKWTMNGPDGKPVIMESDMMVHPDIATDIKNLTEKSWFKANRIPLVSSAVDGLLKFSSILKQTKLSLSLFHLDQEGLHSLFHRINPANLEEINLKDEKQKGLVLGGLQLADYNSQELFSEGLAGGGLVGKIPVIGKLQNWFNDFLFKDYIPKLKMNMATHALDRNIQRYSDKLTKEQIYELTADQANAAFGELNYKMMARNQTVQDTLRLFLLAPDFLEARSKFVGQALRPYGAEQRAALALMGASLYVAGRVLNQALDGDPHYDKPFSIFHEGREYRLRTVLGDVSELIDKPNTFFMNRLSPFGRTGVEFLTGRDSRGIKRNAVEQAEDFLSWFVPIPAQLSPSTTVGSQILSSVGLSNYQHMSQTDTYDAANKWLKSQQDPRIQAMVKKREESTLAESDYKQLKSALLANNIDFAKRELIRLINEKGKTPQDFARSLNVKKPFTGSNAMEMAFISSLNDEQKNQYNKALQERSLIAERFNQLLSQ
jgi:hypothetical protein